MNFLYDFIDHYSKNPLTPLASCNIIFRERRTGKMIEVLRMEKSVLNILITFSLALWLPGCAQNKYAQTIDQLCPKTSDKAQAMSAAEDVLAMMHFDIEKFDVNAGYIRTAPLSGAQSFELWRSDNVGSFNQAEADLQSLRRAVEINITDQAGQMCVGCIATTQKLSIPQGIPGADQSNPIMSSGQKSMQRTRYNLEHKSTMSWTDLGRDNQLETEILKRIEKKLGVTKKEPNK
jgi:hypothetical protein